jgi:hypothetical protein
MHEAQLLTPKCTSSNELALEEDKEKFFATAGKNPKIWSPKAIEKPSDYKDCFLNIVERRKKTNISFAMKRIDMDKLIEISEAVESSGKPAPTFTCRADVIYK